MIRCIQTDHFLSVVVSQGASLRPQMELTPTGGRRKKNHELIIIFNKGDDNYILQIYYIYKSVAVKSQ